MATKKSYSAPNVDGFWGFDRFFTFLPSMSQLDPCFLATATEPLTPASEAAFSLVAAPMPRRTTGAVKRSRGLSLRTLMEALSDEERQAAILALRDSDTPEAAEVHRDTIDKTLSGLDLGKWPRSMLVRLLRIHPVSCVSLG